MIAPRRFLPSIASLRALEALDRLESATAVAEELNLTQSAVSRQLQALEAQLGATLITRDKRRMALTPAAVSYAAEVRAALQQIAQAALRLQVMPEGGTVNLAILPTFGMRWLVPRLADFARLHPDITINMSTRLERLNFGSEPFDAAICFGHGEWPGTDRMRLRRESVVAVCAPALLDGVALHAPGDVRKLPLLHIETRPDAWPEWLAAHGVDSGALAGTLFDQFSTITQAALHGLGAALLPDYLAEQDLATGRLVPVWGDAVEMQGAYYLVWPRSRTHAPALQRFRDWLATQAEDEDPLPR
ncbi:LysR family transcriptional regulator [Sediminimonas sp.]|uniref:LysR family transcriptional regulator n=1 Tax=Sediminimonas sp. TaxID=2823379 RepID=UPI0025E70B8A|nr:LysR family transcriptional regulator [Sediminimonas sp.]